MISSDIIRGYNDTILLSLLIKEDSYGYELSKNIRQITQEQYVIKETTLYSAFSRLERNEYIISYAGKETQGQPRTYYQITEKGKEYFKDKCKEWELTKQVINKFIKKV